MAGIRLVEFSDGLRVFASSGMEARFLHEEIFTNGCYPATLPATPFVVDVGANIGMFTLYVKQRYPAATVLAFEPVPANAAVFRRNAELHRLDGVVLHEVALGAATQRSVPFTYYPALPGNSTRYPERKDQAKAALGRFYTPKVAARLYQGTAITVQVETLSGYLPPDRPVDLLKIDAEGAELDVLRGIDVAQWPLIRQVAAEVHDDEVIDLLQSHDFVVTAEEQAAACLVHAVRS